MDIKYQVGDIVEMKKPHACSPKSKQWELLELSGEIKMKCLNCGHIVFMNRYDFDKRIVKVVKSKGE